MVWRATQRMWSLRHRDVNEYERRAIAAEFYAQWMALQLVLLALAIGIAVGRPGGA